MNFLAHLYIADVTNDSLVGHLLGDFVKGRALGDYDPQIRSAILFHRKIDSFCDTHPVTRISRNRITARRRRFAGIIVDVCYDHFLARHWRRFHPEPLVDFARNAYAALRQASRPLPGRFNAVLTRMIAYDWLNGYGCLENVAMALDRIAGRLSRGERFTGAIDDIKRNYDGLEQDFSEFFPKLIHFSKDFRRMQLAGGEASRHERIAHGHV